MTPTAFVTGSDQGLGRALCRQFRAEGFSVFAACHALYRDGEAERETDDGVELPLEVTDLRSVAAAVESVRRRAGHLDVLVNNAAVNPEPDVPLERVDLEQVDRVFRVNALGPLAVTQAFLPLLERGSKKAVVNVSSEAGSLTTCTRSAWFGYCMSKAALNMQTRLLQNYLSERGFRVFSVHPGWLKTPMANFEGPVLPETAAAGIFRMAVEATAEPPPFATHEGQSYPW